MSYGKAIAVGLGLAVAALAFLESTAGDKKRTWESKNKEYHDDIDKLNEEIKKKVRDTAQELDFKELINLHYMSFKTADKTKLLLNDAYDALKAIGQTILKLKNGLIEVQDKIKNEKNYESRKILYKEADEIRKTRKQLFLEQDQMKEQKESLSNKLKEFNANTHHLKLKIRDCTGEGGRIWFERLEARKGV